MKGTAKFMGKVVLKLFIVGLCAVIGTTEVTDFVRYFNGDSDNLPI